MIVNKWCNADAELWGNEETQKLVEMTLEGLERSAISVALGTNRSVNAISNRQSRLRHEGLLPRPDFKSGRQRKQIVQDKSFYNERDATAVADHLDRYWRDRGWTTQVFVISPHGPQAWIVKSNLVAGLPPGKPNPALKTRTRS